LCGDITLHWEGTGEPVETADGFERPATLTGTIHYPGYFTAPISTVVWGPTTIGVLAPA
jgi:hypothetical protein